MQRSNSSSVIAVVLCRDITEKHRRLAEITEMIHTASLMHDDVVDESPVRRGAFSAAVTDVCWQILLLDALNRVC